MKSTRDFVSSGIKTRAQSFFAFFFFFPSLSPRRPLASSRITTVFWLFLFLERGPIRRGRAIRSTFEAFYVTCLPEFAIDLESTFLFRSETVPARIFRVQLFEVELKHPYRHRTRGSTPWWHPCRYARCCPRVRGVLDGHETSGNCAVCM